MLNYTKAYTCFGVKCAVAPDIPNNYGSLLPITFSAPEGSILNAPRPYAVAARHIIGHLLPDTAAAERFHWATRETARDPTRDARP